MADATLATTVRNCLSPLTSFFSTPGNPSSPLRGPLLRPAASRGFLAASRFGGSCVRNKAGARRTLQQTLNPA